MIRAALINDTRENRHFGCERVVSAIESLCVRHGICITERVSVLESWRDDPARIQRIEELDLVLINGEGTIHHDRPAGVELVEAGVHFRGRGVPVALINTTWYANRPHLAAEIATFDLVAVRESKSHRELLPTVPHVRLVADLALHEPVPAAAGRIGIGFTDCVRSDVTLALHRLHRRHGGRLLNILSNRSDLGSLVYYLRALEVRRPPRRRETPKRLVAALRMLLTQSADAAAFDAAISGLSLLVTGRFHAAVIALAAGTPMLGVASNTPKISATLADAGLGAWRVVPPDRIDRALLDRAMQFEGDEVESMAQYVQEQRELQEALFEDLASLAR